MPIPNPSKDEDKTKFISRCMGDAVMLKEYPDSKQRSGICYSQFDKASKKSAQPVKPVMKPLAENVDVVEISCPTCQGDKFDSAGDHLKCAGCGQLVERKLEAKEFNPEHDELGRFASGGGGGGGSSSGKSSKAVGDAKINSPEAKQALKDMEDGDKELAQITQQIKDEKDPSKLDSLLKQQAGIRAQVDTARRRYTQATMIKSEEGADYPASAYAYAPDPVKPSEWKLRLWETTETKVTKAQLGRAAAALSPGGLKGVRADIPKEDLSAVKRRIRAEYLNLNVAETDIPRWVKENEFRSLFRTTVPLTEATVTDQGIARIVVIRAGFGNSKDNHYYPKETLARDYKVFEGAKMMADHPTLEEEKQRPEGSIKQWVASLKNVHFEEGVGIVGDAIIIEPWLQQKLANLRDKNLLSEIGISIRAAGAGTKGQAEGREANIVERIVRARSVDFVTEAGAGGQVLMYESEGEFDVDVISTETLKSRRPDLVKSIVDEVKSTLMKEAKQAMETEQELKELKGQVATLTTERDTAQAALAESQKAERIAAVKSGVTELISKSELPEPAKARLTERFKEAESVDGVADAIKAEKAYVDTLKEAGKVKGLGGSTPDPVKAKELLKESVKGMHPEWSDAQLNTFVEGR